MSNKITPLTSTQIDKAKPKQKEYTLNDGSGLALRIKPIGEKFASLITNDQLLKKEPI